MLVRLADEGNRTILLFVLAMGLGLASLGLFFVGSSNSPTRTEFGLVTAAMVVVFDTPLRTDAY